MFVPLPLHIRHELKTLYEPVYETGVKHCGLCGFLYLKIMYHEVLIVINYTFIN